MSSQTTGKKERDLNQPSKASHIKPRKLYGSQEKNDADNL